jgi:hypothetical protein
MNFLMIKKEKKMSKVVRHNLEVGDAKIRFRNFAGREGQFNPAGKRNFVIFLDQETAKDLQEDGWNIRLLRSRDPEEEPQAYLPVDVEFKNFPPEIWLITSRGKNLLGEDVVGTLDQAEIEIADLVIRPYNWEVGEKKGIKAYLKKAFITIVEDSFTAKYFDVPDGYSAPPFDE